jgi:hypothetical protein
MIMTGRTLILGFICFCCLLEAANAALSAGDRAQRLLESQSINAQSTNNGTNNSNSAGNVNAHPSYQPNTGVFGTPSAVGSAPGKVAPLKR